MKKKAIAWFGSVIAAGVAVTVIGCGDSSMPSPGAPTGAAAVSTGGALTASRHGGDNGPSVHEVEFTGAVQALSGSCATLTLTVAGQHVSTTASTEFTHAACADLAVGDTVEVKGTSSADGAVAASRIQVDRVENEREDEVTAAITAQSGTCPVLTLTVGTTRVTTTASTVFHDGACGALKVGTVIEAKGTTQSDGSLLASRIEPIGGQ